MRHEVTERVEERNKILGAMREMSSGLESQLQAVKNELEDERKKTQVLAVQTPEIKQKLAETEEKAKVTDEKFQKLKGAYTQLREEHINLIRQKAEVDKLATSLRAAAAQHESAKAALQQQLNDRLKDVELLQQNASSSEEIDAYKNEIANLRTELEQSRQKETELDTLKAAMEALEIEHSTVKTEHEVLLNTTTNDLKETKEVLDKLKIEKEEKEAELKMVKEELLSFRESSGDEYKKVVEEKEAALKQVVEITQQYQREKEDILQQNTVLEADIATLRIQLEEAKKDLEKQNTRIMACAGETAVEIAQNALDVFEGSQEWSRTSAEVATKAFNELSKHNQVKGNEETLAKSALLVAHSTAQLSAYITEVSNISTDVLVSEKLNKECKTMLTTTKQYLEAVVNGELGNVLCEEARTVVFAAMQSAVDAERPSGAGLSVDDELAGMDQAIEEAASQIENLLTATRASDSGVQLEVNSNILDACTTLMAAVKVLVRDSRELQEELGDTKTRQKMYRKNPQWSEGLVSASKAVVFAAKLLVSSADEAVSAAGRVEGVSAAAHEVAGSTAQLVAASRARASPKSEPLRRLHAASRRVAAATGAVVHAARAALRLRADLDALDTSTLTLTATRRLEMECKVHALELETALEAERAKLAALRKRHYQLAQQEEVSMLLESQEITKTKFEHAKMCCFTNTQTL
ncbi:hypothetical protein ACJJTC_004840 [Scirpophaga incertulas]